MFLRSVLKQKSIFNMKSVINKHCFSSNATTKDFFDIRTSPSSISTYIAESDFPNYVINLIIYTLLNKNMHDKVLKIVKYRKVFEVLKELNIIKTRN